LVSHPFIHGPQRLICLRSVCHVRQVLAPAAAADDDDNNNNDGGGGGGDDGDDDENEPAARVGYASTEPSDMTSL